jgi:hypothetical protein
MLVIGEPMKGIEGCKGWPSNEDWHDAEQRGLARCGKVLTA